MPTTIKCPNCASVIDVDNALSADMEQKLKQRYEQQLQESVSQLNNERKRLEDEQKLFDEKKKRENELFQQKLQQEKLKLEQELQQQHPSDAVISWQDLLADHAWTQRRLQRVLSSAEKRGLLQCLPEHRFRLTGRGQAEAESIVRNHRLWELYLAHYGDIAPADAHRFADRIEHFADPTVAAQLRGLLEKDTAVLPQSVHPLDQPSNPPHST